ncbi:hypothetical protein Tco_0422902 [Tanacetum coccineum]
MPVWPDPVDLGEIGSYHGEIVEGWQSARIARLSNLHERIPIRCVLTGVHALLVALSLVIVEGASENDSTCLFGPTRWTVRDIVGGIGPYLGGAARRRACSHGQLHTLFSRPTLTNLSPTLKPLKEYDETDA